MSKETMKLALGKIKSARDCHPNAVDALLFEAEEILEEALAEQPAQQEPVAWMDASGDIYKHELWPDWNPPHTPLYTSPQPAQQPAPMSQPNRVVAYSAASKLRELGYEWVDDAWRHLDELAEQPAPVQQCMDHGECFGGKCIYPAQQPLQQQEPVAILNHAHGVYAFRSVKLNGLPDGEYDLYTSPPAQRTWVGLTVAEMEKLTLLVGRMDYTRMLQLAEAKLKEKNT